MNSICSVHVIAIKWGWRRRKRLACLHVNGVMVELAPLHATVGSRNKSEVRPRGHAWRGRNLVIWSCMHREGPCTCPLLISDHPHALKQTVFCCSSKLSKLISTNSLHSKNFTVWPRLPVK